MAEADVSLAPTQPHALSPISYQVSRDAVRKVRHIWESAPHTRHCSHWREFKPCSARPLLAPSPPPTPAALTSGFPACGLSLAWPQDTRLYGAILPKSGALMVA